MLKWFLETLELDLKYTWKISRGSTNTKINYIIKIIDGDFISLGEVAGITQTEAQGQLIPTEFNKIDFSKIKTVDDIYKLNISSPLRFGLESAFIHLQCQKQNLSVWDFFHISQPKNMLTSFSLPILDLKDIPKFINEHQVERFPSCKIKIGKEHPAESCKTVAKYFKGPLRVDANESFSSYKEVLNFINQTKDLPIEFLEQPLSSKLTTEYVELKKQCSLPIFADESVQADVISENFVNQFHGVNIKLMKAGGYTQALKQIKSAKDLGLKIMLGCMVETSLGIKSALHISSQADFLDLDGFLFFKDEPFKMVTENQGELFLN